MAIYTARVVGSDQNATFTDKNALANIICFILSALISLII